MFDNRYEFNLGNGNRKTRTRPGSDDVPQSFSQAHIAPSQIVQELPTPDYAAWRAGLFAPEYPDERRERMVREAVRRIGGPDEPTSLAYAAKWARNRSKETRTWRKFQI